MGAAPILTILKSGEPVKSCPLEGEVLLGRAEGCVIRLDDRAISRKHALFRSVGDSVQVEQKSEFAPLMVNGKECTKAVLREGDVVSLGPYEIRLSIPEQKLEPESLPVSKPRETVPFSVIQGGGSESLAKIEKDLLSDSLDLEAPEQEGEAESILEGGESESNEGEILDIGGLSGVEQNASAVPESPVDLLPNPLDAATDAITKLSELPDFAVKLTFRPGTANVESFEITKDEIVIGRGKDCDIILNDKKASRKNTIIRRAGIHFVVKDLESANGTYVNGAKVRELELSGDDVVMIGETEFTFKAENPEYFEEAPDFLSPSKIMEVPEGFQEPEKNELALPVTGPDSAGSLNNAPMQPPQFINNLNPTGTENVQSIAGIAGISGSEKKSNTLLGKYLEKFRHLPKQRQYLVIVLVVAVLYLFLFDDEPEQVKKPAKKPVAAAVANKRKALKTFEQLSKKDRQFIENQYNLAFEYYKNREYDKALFEIQKVFALVSDYKDSRDIERYAREGKRKMEAMEEEKRRKEEEVRLKAKVAQLVDEVKDRMAKKEYEQAKELFTEILTMDPDNTDVSNWRRELEEYEEQKRLEEQAKQVQDQINKHGWDVYKEGDALRKQGKYISAIARFQKVIDMGASEPALLKTNRTMMRRTRLALTRLRDPILNEAMQLEESGEFAKAFKLYHRATQIDPNHRAGFEGMNRIRGALHERAKVIYTEAVLAESYSDFSTAKKKFQECLETAPKDDIYFERAQRKLARFFRSGEGF